MSTTTKKKKKQISLRLRDPTFTAYFESLSYSKEAVPLKSPVSERSDLVLDPLLRMKNFLDLYSSGQTPLATRPSMYDPRKGQSRLEIEFEHTFTGAGGNSSPSVRFESII